MTNTPTPPRARGPARSRQEGVMSMFVAVLLLVGVLLILGQAMGIIGTRSADNIQQLDSTAALVLAESGLQRSQAIVGSSASYGTDATCTGITGGPFALGRGSFTYGTSVSTPPTCGLSGGAPCEECTVTVTGTVGSAARTLKHQYFMAVSNGVAGRGQTVTMVLKNTFSVPAMALFNLAWQRQSSGGNADATFCANGATGCGLRWNEESSSGNPSIGGMGVTVDIPPNTLSKVVVQNISQSRDYVEVGGLFPSTSSTSTPTVVGAFWDDKHNTHLTAVNSGSSGGVINGAYKGAGTPLCTNPPTTYPSGGTGSFQADTCTNWCSSADTLIFGVAARSATSADKLNTVTFNVSGSPSGGLAQNIVMTKLVHFPNEDGSTPNASGKAYSEIWWAHNPDYYLPLSGLGATSYPAVLSATVGATVNTNTITALATSMTVTSFSDANAKICIGDVLTRTSNPDRFQSNTTVTGTPSGGGVQCSNAAGVYTFSPATDNHDMNSPVLATSKKLIVQQIVGSVTLNTPLQLSGVNAFTPTAVVSPDTNVYQLTPSAAAPSGQPRSIQIYSQGVSGTTISLPSGTAAITPGTIVQVYSGTGQFAAQTTVLASPAPTSTSFTVSQAPATGITGAAICGGTCALFNSPSNNASVTNFTVSKSSGTSQFSGGFVCLSGVDRNNIIPVTATTLKTGRWQEAVQ